MMKRTILSLALCLNVPLPAASKPNILFIIADDASLHFGAAYDCSWVKTPHIDRLAKQGLVFTNAYTPTAKCAPSRSAILTGRNPWQLGAAANHQPIFPPQYKAFTEAVHNAGCHTGSLGKTWGPGEALTTEGKPRDWGMAKCDFQKFLSTRPKDAPFFYWFGSANPHRPYKPGAEIAAGERLAAIQRVPAIWPDIDTVRNDMLDYAAEIEAFDAEVGDHLKALEESDEAENTLIIVTSDNGMPFPRSKGHNYDISNHLPLIACWPNGIKNPGRRVDELISFIDFAPTFLEILGMDAAKSGMSRITGQSFTDLLRDKPEHDRSRVILGRERNDLNARPGTESGLGYPIRAIREGKLLYLHNFTPDRWPCGNPELELKDTDKGPTKNWIEGLGENNPFWQLAFGKRPKEELYDIKADPDCLNNLATHAEHRTDVLSLRGKLMTELKKQGDPRVLGQGDAFDNYPGRKNSASAKKEKK
ncbi:MAG: sulfatase [Armatimonadetes bacterium]|nr:sulfatase [Akkermansiaceae bacterium]